MSIQKISLVIFMAFIGQGVMAGHFSPNNISVEVINDRGRELPTYAAPNRRNDNVIKTYLEAKPQQAYAIRVTNHSNERVGFVIAVDGRNIISGKKSKLKSNERKYVLEPYQQGTYKGWRTSKNRINEFYFTQEDNSYSAAFGDYSAMGVIAVAAFRDRDRYEYEQYEDADGYSRKNSQNRRMDSKAPTARMEKRAGESTSQPGTGYGDERYSNSRRVNFNEEKHAAVKFLMKYEWRETLCDMGVTDCYTRKQRNRLWDEDRRWGRQQGFAPPPPRYRSYRRVSRY